MPCVTIEDVKRNGRDYTLLTVKHGFGTEKEYPVQYFIERCNLLRYHEKDSTEVLTKKVPLNYKLNKDDGDLYMTPLFAFCSIESNTVYEVIDAIGKFKRNLKLTEHYLEKPVRILKTLIHEK